MAKMIEDFDVTELSSEEAFGAMHVNVTVVCDTMASLCHKEKVPALSLCIHSLRYIHQSPDF